MPIKLIYFPIPGRAEVSRLLLTIGKVDFEDVRVTDWPALKPKTPFGQIPVLEVDGKQLAQMSAIDMYVSKLSGLMPKDPWEAALADQAYFFSEDVFKVFQPHLFTQDPEEKSKALKAAAESQAFKDKMGYLVKLLETKPGRFVSGDEVTHGDLSLFVTLSCLKSGAGMFSGMPKDVLSAYPTIQSYRNAIASLEPVAAFYDKETDELRAAFRADTEEA